jgi:AcrR family transcriptional regulator
MVRISKDPDKRKHELISAAERLFLTKGYEQTSVSDIVKDINVAQGTFYYHFRSKADILEEVVKKHIFSLVERICSVVEKKEMDVVVKLNKFFDTLVKFGTLNKELVSFIHQQSNLVLHERLGNITIARLVPLLSKIIQDGVTEGIFTVRYPIEVARFILLGIGEMFHDPEMLRDAKRIKKARITVEQSVARVLGIEEGSIKMHF